MEWVQSVPGLISRIIHGPTFPWTPEGTETIRIYSVQCKSGKVGAFLPLSLQIQVKVSNFCIHKKIEQLSTALNVSIRAAGQQWEFRKVKS